MTRIYELTPAVMLLILLVSISASTMASVRVRAKDGGLITRTQQMLPPVFYASRNIAKEHKVRRAASDNSTLVLTLVAYAAGFPVLPFAFFIAALIVVCAIDMRTKRLPHKWTAIVFVSSVAFAAMLTQSLSATLIAVACGLGLALVYFIAGVLSGGGIGMGDVYLALGAGTFAAAFSPLGAVVVFIAAGAFSVLFIIIKFAMQRGKMSRKQQVPYGPFIGLGALFVAALSVLVTNYGTDWSAGLPALEIFMREFIQ